MNEKRGEGNKERERKTEAKQDRREREQDPKHIYISYTITFMEILGADRIIFRRMQLRRRRLVDVEAQVCRRSGVGGHFRSLSFF